MGVGAIASEASARKETRTAIREEKSMKARESEDTLIERSSRKNMQAVCDRVEEVCKAHKFGMLGTLDLQEKMKSKGIDFGRPCRIFEVCNPQSAAEVLNQNMRIATSLPCRIAIYAAGEGEEGCVISTVKPTRLMELYDAPGAMAEAKEIEDTMRAIVEELAK